MNDRLSFVNQKNDRMEFFAWKRRAGHTSWRLDGSPCQENCCEMLTAGQKIRRGFNRFAALGAVGGAIGCIALLVAGVTFVLPPANIADLERAALELRQAETARAQKGPWNQFATPNPPAGFKAADAATSAKLDAQTQFDRAVSEQGRWVEAAIAIAAGSVALGVVWFAFWRTVGWVIAGFFD